MKARAGVTLLGLILLMSFIGLCFGDLQVGFYNRKCGFRDVEQIVGNVVTTQFIKDPTIAPALLRLQFHDCFVRGCDASILLDGNTTEKTAFPNLSLRGFDVIDQAKAVVERACPGLVSCADLIVMAARDAVFLDGGERYNVQTGRRDGLVSLASEVNLPSPSASISQAIAAFGNKGLSPTDMVLLLGGHTVGVAHCSLILDRLYNFQNTGKPDPTMDPSLVSILRLSCPQNATKDNTVSLDQNQLSTNLFDNSYYGQLLRNRGILQIDQELALDPQTRVTVMSLANGSNFTILFGQAMVKMGAVEVLTGTQGQIRKSCRAIITDQNGEGKNWFPVHEASRVNSDRNEEGRKERFNAQGFHH
ncbi:peroxidase 60-like [Telopea speciosissima]|uniref:peroxidase 60-like n=1 Tax=Telopea speciosissima TaxID=54955 RepID=UPI001CC46045|nr:peroxidase 60-like [Telopea speciosissima]